MQSDRVRAILEGIGSHQELGVSADERDALLALGLVKNVDPATRDRWVADVASLPSLRDRVRDLSRQALATPGPDAPPELRALIGSLEELTREKATLDGLVWNGPTQEYFLVPLVGRTVLEDLNRLVEGKSAVHLQVRLPDGWPGADGVEGPDEGERESLQVVAGAGHGEPDVFLLQADGVECLPDDRDEHLDLVAGGFDGGQELSRRDDRDGSHTYSR